MDRNKWIKARYPGCRLSLSARRAWIEIPAGCWRDARRASLSARRAWIEIGSGTYHPHFHVVALRKESVDRNTLPLVLISPRIGRSPQGERG